MFEKVTVVIPCHDSNRNKLERTIRSVLGQSWTNMEIIIVDDGSRVPFSGVDKMASLGDGRLHWLTIGENCGVARARNTAVKRATGVYLAFLDTGDWWEPEKLAEQINVLRRNRNAGLVYTSAIVHKTDNVKILEATVEGDAYRQLLVTQPITGSASSVIMPTKVFRDLGGFFEDYDIPEDRDLWLRVAEKYKVFAVRRPLVHLEVDPEGRSSNPNKKSVTYALFLQRHRKIIRAEGMWHSAMYNKDMGLCIKFLRHGSVAKFIFHGISAVLHFSLSYAERSFKRKP